MAQKLIFLHNGTRKTLGFGPRTIVQEVIGQVADLFQLDRSKVSLKHKTTILNPAETLFLMGIPNNAVVEIVIASGRSADSSTKLTLVAQDKTNISLSMPSSSTLRDVVEQISQEVSPSSVVVGLTYMRKPYVGEELFNVTLSSLGLAGQAAKFQLIYSTIETTDESVNKMACESSMEVSIPENNFREGADSVARELTRPPPLIAGRSSTAVPEHPEALQSAEAEYDATAPSVQRACEHAVSIMLSSNFDVATSAAIMLLVKYIDNIIKHPEKLSKVKGHELFLASAGFLVAPEDPYVWVLRKELADKSASHLPIVRRALLTGADSLGIPDEELPRQAPAVSLPAPPVKTFEFDPFKAMVTRTAAVPERDGAGIAASNTKILSSGLPPSESDLRLARVEERRRALEGRPEDVERSTEVILPTSLGNSSGAPLVLRQGTDDGDVLSGGDLDDRALARLDARLVAQQLGGRSRTLAGDGSDPPLLTNTIRQLEKAKKELVYNRCLVRVRFPDKVVVQGIFHPRDKMNAVYDWLGSCMLGTSGGSLAFELYMSPPKTVLAANLEQSLFELGMVPAVSLLLGWVGDRAQSRHPSATVDCLIPGLLLPAVPPSDDVAEAKGLPGASEDISGALRGSLAFPQGVKLVPGKFVDSEASEKGPSRSAVEVADAEHRQGSVGEKKPKWFKL